MALFYQYPFLVEDLAKGAREGSEVVECTERHFYYLCSILGGLPYHRKGATLYLSRSVYGAWRFAQARTHAAWTEDETAWVDMYLKVQKAQAMLQEMAGRGIAPDQLCRDEVACFAAVMEDAIMAVAKAYAIVSPPRGRTMDVSEDKHAAI